MKLPVALCLLLLAVPGAYGARATREALPDPTRPPAEVSAGTGAQAGERAVSGRNRGLQVVIIAPNRRAAVIDGHTVELGAKYGVYTLIEVTEAAVVLRDVGGKRVVLTMFPTGGVTRKEPVPAQKPHTDRTGKTDAQAGKATAPPATTQGVP